MTLPFTLNFNSSPIFTPTGVSGDQDSTSIRDGCFLRTGTGWTYGYTGFRPASPHWAEVMAATASAPAGPFTREGVILPLGGSGGQPGTSTVGTSDPCFIFDGSSTWYAFYSAIPTDTGLGHRTVGLFTASGTAAALPTTGWTLQTLTALRCNGSTWTNTSYSGGQPAGVSSPKVYPKVGGGWIMYFCAWGESGTVGYATASSLNGPWSIDSTPLFGLMVDGNYAAEQVQYFRYQGKHYLFVASLSTNGSPWADSSKIHPTTDLWVADSQTGPYTEVQADIFGFKAGGGYSGTVALDGYDLDAGPLNGIVDGWPNPITDGVALQSYGFSLVDSGGPGSGILTGVSAATSTASITGIGIALGIGSLTGVSAATSVNSIDGMGAIVNGINQIRAPDGTLRIWRNIYGDVITFNAIGV